MMMMILELDMLLDTGCICLSLRLGSSLHHLTDLMGSISSLNSLKLLLFGSYREFRDGFGIWHANRIYLGIIHT